MVAFAAADVKYLYDAPYNKETVVTTGTLGSASSYVKQEFIAPVTATFSSGRSLKPILDRSQTA